MDAQPLLEPYPYGPDDGHETLTPKDDDMDGRARRLVVRHRDGARCAAAAGIDPATGSTTWVFVWCCVLPLFPSSALRPLWTLGL